jgi:hypothetical protein
MARKSQKEYSRLYHLAHKDDPHYNKVRLVSKRKKYKLTPEQYAVKLYSQQGICALCGKVFVVDAGPKHKFSPVLDHNHKTGKNRDFVHRACNVALGYLYDDPTVCRKAADYLEKHERTQ